MADVIPCAESDTVPQDPQDDADNVDIADDDDELLQGQQCHTVVLSPDRPNVATIADPPPCDSDDAGDYDAVEEEDQWRNRRKHIFILTSAGKPVFSRYGDESDFSELFGILQVLISMAQSNSDSAAQESLRRVAAGPDFMIHFYTAGELSYVMVTRTEESTKSCVRQLRLLHLQMLSVIPTVNAVLKKSPGYDIRRIFSHADTNVMRHLIKRLSCDPSYLFRAARIAPLPPDMRRDLDRALVDVRSKEQNAEDHLYSLILFDGAIVSSIAPKENPLHIDDLLLLQNFTACVSASQRGEVWAPICLPRFNDTGYLWCYCNSLIPTGSTCPRRLLLVQLATTQEAFPTMSSACSELSVTLNARGLLREVEMYCDRNPHFCWKSLGLSPPNLIPQWFGVCTESRQLVCSQMPPPMRLSKKVKKMVLRQFVKLRDKLAILSRASNPLVIHCTEDQSFVVLRQKNFEVCAAFLPFVARKDMVESVQKVLKSVAAKENHVALAKPTLWKE